MPRQAKKDWEIYQFKQSETHRVTQHDLRIMENRIRKKNVFATFMFTASLILFVFMISMTCLLIGVWLKS